MSSSISPQFKIVILALFVAIGWLLFALALSIYNDYQTDVRIAEFRKYNARLAAEESEKPKQFFYEKLRLTQEKWRKENLNEKNLGEKVIVIESNQANEGKLFSFEPEVEDTMLLSNNNKTNPQRWWDYFFGKESAQ